MFLCEWNGSNEGVTYINVHEYVNVRVSPFEDNSFLQAIS